VIIGITKTIPFFFKAVLTQENQQKLEEVGEWQFISVLSKFFNNESLLKYPLTLEEVEAVQVELLLLMQFKQCDLN
jgi:hypothetical protein